MIIALLPKIKDSKGAIKKLNYTHTVYTNALYDSNKKNQIK